ncbi:MAG TPA: TonB-dependent receptor [Caulobacteraceae bacterium]
MIGGSLAEPDLLGDRRDGATSGGVAVRRDRRRAKAAARRAAIIALTWAAGARTPATAADAASAVGEVEVTATRAPEAADRVPVYITVLHGDDLRARHITDLRTALALVAGVEAPSGGDAGPAGAVPSFWGLHEFDAFLLVVDGVPWGGAFNPATAALDLTDVERIEVLKGSAPVLYGATSFVGVIQVIHYPASAAANRIEAGYGGLGSWRADGSMTLPQIGEMRQSIAVDARRDGFSDPRESVRAVRALYRASRPLAGGEWRFDLDLAALRSVPPSPVVRVGTALTTLTPLDANYNPADARIDENRYHGVLGYSRETPLGPWETTVSIAYSRITDIRGFLRPNLLAADSQNQHREIDDDYVDSHIASELWSGADLTWGADLLYGRAAQASLNGAYAPALQGGPLPRTTDLHVDEINALLDRRLFAGQYAQLDWKLDSRLDLNAGLRLNETQERKRSTHLDGLDAAVDSFDQRLRNVTRISAMAALSYRAWTAGADELVLYADARDTFKPAAIDFGPDYTPDILEPEIARSFEAGAKGRLAGGRVDYEGGLFLLDFSNLVVATTDAAGDHILQNAGGERLEGVEAEGRWRVATDLALAAAVSWHDARFTHFIAAEGGANIDASGNQLTLSPHILSSFGVILSPPQGVFGFATVSYVGPRFLDLANSASTGAYVTVDGGLGYRWRRYTVAVNGCNLTNERRPVTASEFGDQSFYLSPARKVFVDVSAAF